MPRCCPRFSPSEGISARRCAGGWRLFPLAAVLGVIAFAGTRGEDWPAWRGPRGDGTSLETDLPIHWDGTTGQNVRWKVPLVGSGHASPIVWQDRLFLVSCDEMRHERLLLCYDRRDGRLLWQRTVLNSPLESKHALNSYASSTPATDGRRVFVSFLEVDGHLIPAPNVGTPRDITPGRMVVAAYDLEGNRLWITRPGPFISAHGYCASPVLFENLVIVNGDHDGDSYLVALDQATGQIVWKVPRLYKTRSYVTPLVRTLAGRTQLLLSGSRHVASFDPRTGQLLWKVEGPTEQFVSSPVDNGQLVFFTAGYPTYHVLAIRPDGEGDVTNSHVVWHETSAKCYVPSPVVVGPHLIVADDRGTANCFEAASGRRLWQARLGSHFNNSLVTAGGLVYLTADDGLTKVIHPGPELEVVAESPLGERCEASLALAHGCVFIRGERHLFCFGRPE